MGKRFFSSVFLAATVLLISPVRAHAGLALIGDASNVWLRGGSSASGAPQTKYGAELGILTRNKNWFIGLYGDSFQGFANTYNYGLSIRAYLSQHFFIGMKVDLVSLLAFALEAAVLKSPSYYYGNTTMLDYFGYGLSTGARFPFGQHLSLQPYVAFDSFVSPWDPSKPPNRYFAPTAGAKLAIEF